MNNEANNIRQLTQQEWDQLSEDYKGELTTEVWEFRGRDFPEEWIGRKTWLTFDRGTVLLIEDVGFAIVK